MNEERLASFSFGRLASRFSFLYTSKPVRWQTGLLAIDLACQKVDSLPHKGTFVHLLALL